jgi:thiol:disulfide interchange protein
MRPELLLALALLVSAVPAVLPAPAAAASAITWHDFEDGTNLSLNGRRPAMVDFATSWCSWCKKMDAETYSDARVINRSESMVCIRVDGDARGDLVARYKVDGYPTTVFLNPDGSEMHRVVGYKGPGDFLKDLDYVLGRGPRPVDSPGGPSPIAFLPLLLIPAVILLGRKWKGGKEK